MADIVELITSQHRAIDTLLEQAEQGEPDQVSDVLQQVAALLRPHSEAEESFVYPAIRDHDRAEDGEVKDGVAEHHHIEGLLDQLLAEDPSGPGFDGKLAAMIGELRHHVEEEERDLLPVLSERASAEERAELGARFGEATGHRPDDAGGSGGRRATSSSATSSSKGARSSGKSGRARAGAAGGAVKDAVTNPGGATKERATRAGSTRAELYEEARERGISGRSTMTKDELAAALETDRT